MALIDKWHCFRSLSDTYDKGAPGGIDNLVGNEGQLVDLHDPLDLGEQPMQEAEIAAGDAGDRGDGLRVRKISVVQTDAQRAPMTRQNEGQLVAGERPVMMREPDAAVKLWDPDLNPIEKAYAKLKAHLRKLAERTVSGLMALLETCAYIFKPKEAENFFAACGYDTD